MAIIIYIKASFIIIHHHQLMHSPNTLQERLITIRQEQQVQQILNENMSIDPPQLDSELLQLIQEDQDKIKYEYESRAMERVQQNRSAINFDEVMEVMNALNEKDEEMSEHHSQYSEDQEPPRSPLKHYSDYEAPDSPFRPLRPIIKTSSRKQPFLQSFEQVELQKARLTEQQILELDSKYPKINYMSMLHHKFPIFSFRQSPIQKWLNFQRMQPQDMNHVLRFVVADVEWTVVGLKRQIVIFRIEREDWKEPTVVGFERDIAGLCVGRDARFVAVYFVSQISVYQIRRNQEMVLFKHLSDSKLPLISTLHFLNEQPLQFYLFTHTHQIYLVFLETTLIFSKLKIQQVSHGVGFVMTSGVIKLDNGDTLLCLANREKMEVHRMEKQIQFMGRYRVEASPNSPVNVRWRKSKSLSRPQLLLAFDNKVVIYKLQQEDVDGVCYYLKQHLIYPNLHPVKEIHIISEYHLMIVSQENIIVVAIPLIPSIAEEQHVEEFQNAIVFISEVRQSKILSVRSEGIFYYYKNDENPTQNKYMVNVATLKPLESFISHLMVTNSEYRQSFTLLILVHKGINYSFNFSYNYHKLHQIILSSIDCCLSSIMPIVDTKISSFRIGWIVQLIIDCKIEEVLWGFVYNKVQEKGLQHILFEVVEIFILKEQITKIPEKVFFQLINHYANENKLALLQKIIICNTLPYEPTMLLTLINKHELFYLQFYLFSQSILSDQYDFYTPFLRVFIAFSRYYDEKNDKYERIGTMCLWYMWKCFQFEEIPKGGMKRDQKEKVVSQLFMQILAKTFIKKLSEFNMKMLLQVLLKAVTEKQFLELLEEEQPMYIDKLNQLHLKLPEAPSDFFKLLLQHLESIITIKNFVYIFSEFESLVIYFSKCEISFDKVIDLLICLFENECYQYQLEKEDFWPSTEELKVYLVELIKEELDTRTDRLWIRKLLAFEDREVSYLLYKIDKNYFSCLQHYLSTRGTSNIFNLIYEILDIIETYSLDNPIYRERKFIDVKNFATKHISLFFRSESSKTLELFHYLGQTTSKIHNIINTNLCEKLYFLNAVFNKFGGQEFQNKEQYMVQHLEEVCSLPEEQMIDYLNRYYYPLDLAIRVCQSKGNYLAKAIFEQRSGQVEDAFKSYEKLIRIIIYNSKESEQEIKKKVNKYICRCVQICKQFSTQSLENNLWIKLIKFISGFMLSTSQYKIFLKVEFQRLIHHIINEMFNFLHTLLLVEFFTVKINKLDIGASKELAIYERLNRVVKFDIANVKRAGLVAKLDSLLGRREISIDNKRGIKLDNICDFCKGDLEEQLKYMLYSCGHSFHKVCHDDPLKCLTCFYNSDDAILMNIIFKLDKKQVPDKKRQRRKSKKINNEIYVETRQQAKIEQRKKRLKVFDYEVQKVDRENQQTVDSRMIQYV